MRHLIIIAIVLLAGCRQQYNVPPAVLVEHRQGKHYAVDSDPIAALMDRKDPSGDSYTFLFTESCRYFIPKEGDAPCYLGWNKALGTTSIFIHKNSHRLAWRYNCIRDLFEVATYSYTDGVREWEIVGEGSPGEQIRVDHFELMYLAYPAAYFGGTNPAPHDMHYFIY